ILEDPEGGLTIPDRMRLSQLVAQLGLSEAQVAVLKEGSALDGIDRRDRPKKSPNGQYEKKYSPSSQIDVLEQLQKMDETVNEDVTIRLLTGQDNVKTASGGSLAQGPGHPL